ncbi:MAG: ATP-grasp domain-containing protein [Desulfobacteraceae bacterium]|nr:ATP-grasp domain-containing protein [Desulfobacteraceae bacterium]MBC2756741.1 ATP-grasp domain-containing protein [Desulfobacteraceae bacterium]
MNVLVLSAEASAINYIRSLKKRYDMQLFVTDCNKYASGLYDETITPVTIPPARDLENYRNKLDEIIKQYRINILIPTSDYDMEGVLELVNRGWDTPVNFFKPDYNIFHTLSHKKKVMETLHEKGFRVPLIYNNPSEVEYPVVVKPCREAGGKGVSVAVNEKDLLKYISSISRNFGSEIVLQEFIPGDAGSIHVVLLLYGNDGNIYGEVVTKSQLTFMTWGGYGNAGTLAVEPDLLNFSKKIISSMGGWCGPINLEFKKHSGNGHFYLMEVNCRLNGYSYFTTLAGLNYPAAVIELLSTGKTDYLSIEKCNEEANFIIGFRERIVEKWITDEEMI